jgi:predicted enzyme related to lactoylglutathione lyase
LTAKIVFVELPSTRLAEDKAFYSAAFGMAITEFGPSYACTMLGAGNLGWQADAAEAPKTPLAVIEVDDLEATLSAVQAAGAQITKPIFGFPGGRRFHFRDPSGNELAALKAD